MEGVAHNSFKHNKLLPSFLLLITYFITQMLYTLPLGLGTQNGGEKRKTRVKLSWALVSVKSSSSSFWKVVFAIQSFSINVCGKTQLLDTEVRAKKKTIIYTRGWLRAGEDEGDVFQGKEVISNGKRKLLSRDLP